MFQRLHVCVYVSLSATTSREGPTLQDSLPVQKGRRLCLLPLFSFLSLPRASSFSLSMRLCKRACVAASAVFAIFYFAWKMVSRETVRAMRTCPLNRMPYPPFPVCRRFLPCNRKPFPAYTALVPILTRPSLRSPRFWQVATGEDDLSLYFTGRSSSSNKGISFFFPFSFSLHPAFPSALLRSLMSRPPPSIWWCSLLFFLLLFCLTVFLLNDRPFTPLATALPVHVVFHRRARVSPVLSFSLSLSFFSPSRPLTISSSLYHWLPPFTIIDSGNVAFVGRVTRFAL